MISDNGSLRRVSFYVVSMFTLILVFKFLLVRSTYDASQSWQFILQTTLGRNAVSKGSLCAFINLF